ncbi:MAG: AAA family ATPase [Magnetococcales bacterium]|nr:AAA family ATPase [Magnetococcales bacterium]
MIATNTTHEVSATSGILGNRLAKPSSPRLGKGLYFSIRSHAPVWRIFRSSIVQGEGVILITGEQGVGKSCFLSRLKDILPDNRDMVQIQDPTMPADIFLQSLMNAVRFGDQAETALTPIDSTHKQLLEALEERVATGRRLLVAIDQAHMLSDTNAELLSLLVPFSHKGMKPVQLLLVGRPELWGCLESEPFRLIRKEIIGSGEITPLTRSEVLDFIHFFIKKKLGRKIRVSWFAWVDIFAITQGNPFKIEQILNQTLALIKLRPRWIITRSLVKVAQENQPDISMHHGFFGSKAIVFAAVSLVVIVALFSGLFDFSDKEPNFTRVAIPFTSNETASPPVTNKPKIVAAAKEEVEIESTSVAVPAIVTPQQTIRKSKKIIWKPTPRESTISSFVHEPPVSKPHRVKNVFKPMVKKPKKSILSIPAVAPLTKGYFVTPKNLRPMQVVPGMPSTAPLLVGSPDDRMFGKIVEKFQKPSSAETLSAAGLLESTPLPLTTEDTLRSAGKIFVVQIGSFLNRDNAERLMLDLSKQGLEPYVHLFEDGAEKWFSVRLNYRDKTAARDMAEGLSNNMNMPARVIELFYE